MSSSHLQNEHINMICFQFRLHDQLATAISLTNADDDHIDTLQLGLCCASCKPGTWIQLQCVYFLPIFFLYVHAPLTLHSSAVQVLWRLQGCRMTPNGLVT